jgi:hypothetical protein
MAPVGGYSGSGVAALPAAGKDAVRLHEEDPVVPVVLQNNHRLDPAFAPVLRSAGRLLSQVFGIDDESR